MMQNFKSVYKPPHLLYDQNPTDCHFELKTFTKGTTVHNDDSKINYLIYYQSRHARISSTLFQDGILCAGEIIFVLRMSECNGETLSNITLYAKQKIVFCCISITITMWIRKFITAN